MIDIINYEGRILSEEDIRECVDNLRLLCMNDNLLRTIRTDDAYLLRFLHACRFKVKWAFKRLQAFWNMVIEYPEWFKPDGPIEYTKQLQLKIKHVIGEDREGRALYLAKLKNLSLSEISLFEAVHLDDIWIESILDCPKVQRKGLSIVIDVSGSPWGLIKWATPTNIVIGLKKVELYPLVDIVVHVVNTTFVMNTLVKIGWPFLSDQMKNRIKFHYEDMDSLHKYISPDVLPEEYGGTANINYDELNKGLLDRHQEICKTLKYYKQID